MLKKKLKDDIRFFKSTYQFCFVFFIILTCAGFYTGYTYLFIGSLYSLIGWIGCYVIKEINSLNYDVQLMCQEIKKGRK